MKNHSILVERFIKELELRNYSFASIKTYTELLCVLENRVNEDLSKITVADFKKFLHHKMMVEKVSISYINQSISAFKLLQTSVLSREWEHFKIQRPRREHKLPIVLSVSEVEKIIAVTTNIKHKAILMLTYSAGLRKMETIQIKPSAIDSERMQVHVVQGKGKKDRYTILSPKVLDFLRFYYKLETFMPSTPALPLLTITCLKLFASYKDVILVQSLPSVLLRGLVLHFNFCLFTF